MWITLALLSSIIFGLASVIMKAATLKHCSDHYILLGLYTAGTLLFFATTGGQLRFDYSFNFILFACLIAAGSFFGNWAVIKALELGPASLTAPMLNLNLPLFIFMSVFFYHEQMDLIKIIIIIAILFSIVIVKIDPNENLVIKNKKWFLFVFLGAIFLFLREGGLKITQELGFNNKEILLISYFICLILSILNIVYNWKLNKGNPDILSNEHPNVNQLKNIKIFNRNIKINRKIKSVYYGCLAGVCSSVGLYLYSSSLIIGPASLVALIFSARIFVIVFFSYILHKERLSFFQKCSLVIITIGISLAGFTK